VKNHSFWNSRHPACSFPHGILPEMNVPKTVFFLFYDAKADEMEVTGGIEASRPAP